MKIAMFSIHSNPLGQLGTHDTGGMSVYIRELSREIGRAGHQVDIYTRTEDEKESRDIAYTENVRLIHLGIGERGHIPKDMLYPYLPELFRSLEAFRSAGSLNYDIIHSNYWLSAQLGKRARRLWHVPHITMFHTLGIVKRISCSQEKETALRLITEKKLTRSVNRILTQSIREKELLVKYYDVAREKIGVTPCGVNLDRFRPMQKEFARKHLGLHNGGPVILFVGRFAPVKGIDRLLAAMVHLRTHQGLSLVIVGGDGQRTRASSELRHLIRKLGIHDRVSLAGRIDHDRLATYYNAADVLVVPSFYESFGLVALESLACGTPVVATRVGAMESLLRMGETGAIVNTPSPRALALAIKKFVSPSQNGFLSPESIRSSVLSQGWSNVALATINEYVHVINGVPREQDGQILVS